MNHSESKGNRLAIIAAGAVFSSFRSHWQRSEIE